MEIRRRAALCLLLMLLGAGAWLAARPSDAAGEATTRGLRGETVRSQGPATVRAAQAGALRLVEPLTLSTTAGQVGDPMFATARVRNVGDRPVSIRYLIAAGRGPGVPIWDCGELVWSICGADFTSVENLTLQPGQEYAYREGRVPALRGDYWVEMVYQDAETGRWSGVDGSTRLTYTVSGGELVVVEPLTLSPGSGAAGRPMTARARVRNVGDAPLAMRYLAAAGRGPDVPDWDCGEREWEKCAADFSPAEDLVLPPGGEYLYVGLTAGRLPGDYFAEMAYRGAATDRWISGLRGSPRVRYGVTCDPRCQAIRLVHRDVIGREIPLADLATVQSTELDEAAVRAYLCGRADRRVGRCGSQSAGTASFFSFLPINLRGALTVAP